MNRPEQLTLINREYTKLQNGYETTVETQTTIYCNWRDGVSFDEFYTSRKAGLKASASAERKKLLITTSNCGKGCRSNRKTRAIIIHDTALNCNHYFPHISYFQDLTERLGWKKATGQMSGGLIIQKWLS